jgi:hypothetical protein
MLDEFNNWVFSSRFRRRALIKVWRVLLRVQRATLANAVLVVRRKDGWVLALSSTSGELRLPIKELDGWKAVTTQVDEWLEQLLQQRQTPKLVAIDGTPGRQGVTFIYCAEAGLALPDQAGGVWLDPEIALPTLPSSDRRLLLITEPSLARD